MRIVALSQLWGPLKRGMRLYVAAVLSFLEGCLRRSSHVEPQALRSDNLLVRSHKANHRLNHMSNSQILRSGNRHGWTRCKIAGKNRHRVDHRNLIFLVLVVRLPDVCRKLSSDRQTDRHHRNCIPRHFAGGQKSGNAPARLSYI